MMAGVLGMLRTTAGCSRAWAKLPIVAPATAMQVAIAQVWRDGENWLAGHWLNGRLGSVPLSALIEAVLATVPVHPVPAGTVGLPYLRALGLDPAFQLK